MNVRKTCLPLVVLAAFVLAGNLAWALGLELGETKEQLKLKYDVAVVDHGTGRVTITLTIADEGRLAPLDRGVELLIPSKEGTGYVDLSVSLNRRKVEGKQVISVHLTKELAERAAIQLNTDTLDGKVAPLTWYYHSIPIARYLKTEGQNKK
jgi:hypothetical protein